MHRIASLPEHLKAHYQGWKTTTFEENSERFKRLADEGQHPDTMVIACCDSRVNVTEILGKGPGELFVHRNIANVVPMCPTNGGQHATAAALEYAVKVLKVQHIVVLGHSQCGGVQGCLGMCRGEAPELSADDSFVGHWLENLRPAYAKVAAIGDGGARQTAMEKACIQLSLSHLMGYAFVRRAVDRFELSLHGLWTDISEGSMESYNGALGRFDPL